MLKGVSARFACDGCGKEQLVYMDPAMENIPKLMDAAEHSLKEDFLDWSVEPDGRHICRHCEDAREQEEEWVG